MPKNRKVWRLCLLLGWFSSTPVLAEPIRCVAKVALNRIYYVSLDLQRFALQVKTDNGFIYEGTTSRKFSPNTNMDTYYLPVGYNNVSLLVRIDHGRAGETRLCLKENECYLCNP